MIERTLIVVPTLNEASHIGDLLEALLVEVDALDEQVADIVTPGGAAVPAAGLEGGQRARAHARLEHDMSFHRLDKHLDPGNAARHSNQLDAMVRFYNEHGSASERTRLRLDLLRDALRSLAQKHLAEAGRYLRAAVHYPAGLSK